MKALQINSVCGYGSTGRIAIDIYKVLEQQGHECLIAYGRGKAPEGITSIRIGTNLDNFIHVAKTRIFDMHGFASTKATKEFIKKAKEYNPDFIQLHNIHGYYINIELLFNYLKDANKPVIWTLHDCWSFTGHCAYFDYVGCNKWKIGCDRCPQKDVYPKSLLINNSKWNYEKKKKLFTGIKNMTIITPSWWLANLVKQSFLNDYDIKVINNGIDLSVFTPKNKNIFRQKYKIEDKFVILGVASVWEVRKGFNYFLKLSKLVDENSKIVLVGLNDKQLNNLPQNIIGVRRTNSVVELANIYSAADVYINLTLEDNFPTTNLEALACGIPVITYNTGGSVECIDEKCGVVVETKNMEELLSAINKIQGNNFESKNCLNRSKLYDKKNKYYDYITIYEETINENSTH